MSTLRTEATSGNETAIVTEDVQVRIPNPRMTEIEEKKAKSRRDCFFRYPHYRNRTAFCPGGILYPTVKPGTTPQLLARLPSWLCRANHFTGISAISFILASGIKSGQQITAENNVREVINRLRSYQTPEGGFAYWPGEPYISEWATSYAVNFLANAQKQGYAVPIQMLQHATNYMRQVANSWNRTEPWSQQDQAYRL